MLAGKLALITGSTSGIGLGIAKSLANKGANIILNGFGDSNEIEKICKTMNDDYKVKVHYEAADLSKYDDIDNLIKRTSKIGNGVDILVNNAGIQHVSPIESFPKDKYDLIIALNLSAVFHSTSLILPSLKAKNWGRIINVASVHGLIGSADKSAYVASKHGVIGMTKAVALETAKTNITINCICPGWVLTPLVEKQIEAKAKILNVSFNEAKIALLAEKQPSQEFVTPEQLGELAAFLSSEAASQVRGVAWAVDGGWTAQ